MAVGLEFGVPCSAKQPVESVRDGFTAAPDGEHTSNLILSDHKVAVDAHRGPEHAPTGHVHEPFTVVTGARLLGDLEAKHRPTAQGGGEFRTGAGLARPGAFGAPGRRVGRLE